MRPSATSPSADRLRTPRPTNPWCGAFVCLRPPPHRAGGTPGWRGVRTPAFRPLVASRRVVSSRGRGRRVGGVRCCGSNGRNATVGPTAHRGISPARGAGERWRRRHGGPVPVSWAGSGPPVRASVGGRPWYAPLTCAGWSRTVVRRASKRRFVRPRRTRTACCDHSRGTGGDNLEARCRSRGPAPGLLCVRRWVRDRGTRRSPAPGGRELSSGGRRNDGSCAFGTRRRRVVTARRAGRYACSAVFSWMPSPLRCRASTAPLTLLRRNRMFGVPESSAALTVFGVPSGFGAAPTRTTFVPAVT